MKAWGTVLLLLALVVSLGVAAKPAAKADAKADNSITLEAIVARVNNDIITLSDLEQSRELLQQELEQQYKGPELQTQLQEQGKDVLRDLIDEKLLVQHGLDMGLSVETDVIKRLDQIRQQNDLKSMEDLERAVQAQGVAFEDFKQQIRDQIMTQEVIQREVSGRVLVDAEKVHDYYLKHQEEFRQPERVHVREILISTNNVSEANLPAREDRVREVLDKIRHGEKFEDVAKEYSDAPTAKDGGDLGYLDPTKLSPAIREVLSKLNPGGVSDPQRTRDGWLILQLVQHVPAGIPPFDQVENRIRQRLYMSEVQPALRDFLSDLRRDAYVKVMPGYEDSGAVEQEEFHTRRVHGSRRGHHRRPSD